MEVVVAASATTAIPPGQPCPVSPETAVLRRRRSQPRHKEGLPHRSLVCRERCAGRPTPPTPLDSSQSDDSSLDPSSSRSPSAHKKGKSKHTKADKETRRPRPSRFIAEIANCRMLRSLEKLPQPNMYDAKDDPDEHIDTFDLMLDYRNATNDVKCKLSPLSLSKNALQWFRDLTPASVSSWRQLTKLFCTCFTASRLSACYGQYSKARKNRLETTSNGTTRRPLNLHALSNLSPKLYEN